MYSLVILCFHSFDWFTHISWAIMDHSPFAFNGDEYTTFRFIFTFILSFIAIKTPVICDIYGAHKLAYGRQQNSV